MVQLSPCTYSPPGAQLPCSLEGCRSLLAGWRACLGRVRNTALPCMLGGVGCNLGWVFCVAVVCADTRALQTGMPLVACGTPCSAGLSDVCALVVRCQPHPNPVCMQLQAAHPPPQHACVSPTCVSRILAGLCSASTHLSCMCAPSACMPPTQHNFLLCLFSSELLLHSQPPTNRLHIWLPLFCGHVLGVSAAQ